jgi:hypothetical protein
MAVILIVITSSCKESLSQKDVKTSNSYHLLTIRNNIHRQFTYRVITRTDGDNPLEYSFVSKV